MVVCYFFIGIIVLIIISLLIYKFLYDRKIRRALETGNTSGRHWPAPGKIVGAILITGLILYIVSSLRTPVQTADTAKTYEADTIFYSSAELKGTYAENYITAFETGTLAGYRLTEKTEGNFHFMLFSSETEYDRLHPGFILFIEYIGNEEYETYFWSDSTYIDVYNSFGSGTYGEINEYYCIIGNIDFEQYMRYRCTFALYDSSEKMQEDINKENFTDYTDNPHRFVLANEQVTFYIQDGELCIQ